ncbi:hypothetical protein [Bdellovibrio sp. BCCA]|uniref:hypothetical protein n=1 Tax=Bdellovibrio sp. BCCA TaxID=3136281 RepID=UPI0030F25B41
MKAKLLNLIAVFKEAFDQVIEHQDIRLEDSEIDGGINIHAEGTIQLALRYATPGEFVVENGGRLGEDFFDPQSGKDVSMYCIDDESAAFSIDGAKTLSLELSEEEAKSSGQDLANQVNKIIKRVIDFSRERGARNDHIRVRLNEMESQIKSRIQGDDVPEIEKRIFDIAYKAVHSKEFSHLVSETNLRSIQDYLILKLNFFKNKGL